MGFGVRAPQFYSYLLPSLIWITLGKLWNFFESRLLKEGQRVALRLFLMLNNIMHLREF